MMALKHEDSKPRDLKDMGISQKHFAGVAFQNLNVFGFGTPTDCQKTFSNYPLVFLGQLRSLFGRSRNSRIDILRDVQGYSIGIKCMVKDRRIQSGLAMLYGSI